MHSTAHLLAESAAAQVTWAQELTAYVALAGLGTTIFLAWRDRRRADQQLKAEIERHELALKEERERHERDRAEAARQIREERTRAGDERMRQHRMDLLLKVSEAYAELRGHKRMPQEDAARERLRVLLHLVPDGSQTYLKDALGLRLKYDDEQGLERFLETVVPQPDGETEKPYAEWVYEELRQDIEVLMGPEPPEGW
ncbi:hypothetical protein [Streptomyces boninensis]|uniref:hypothetical protein n=1 Tax=Streptomyces boninensis TaxID=2039455 RepID=UPI003B2273AC